ncbi:hypothetical protein Dimus_002429 [Dionaea muscipula]
MKIQIGAFGPFKIVEPSTSSFFRVPSLASAFPFRLRHAAGKISTMKPENLLHRHHQSCTLSCPVLDRLLAGGIPCNSVTDIVAESGSGKTQLCLQLLLSSQLPASVGGLSSSSLYLHTEFPFPSRRLHQLSLSFLSAHSSLFPPSHDPLGRILVDPVHTADHLLDVLLRLDSFIMSLSSTRWPIKLIVIDSIAALFRSEFENNPADLRRRSSLFFRISGKLKALAEKFGLAVVVTNQVVDFMGSKDAINGLRIGNLDCLYSSGRRVCPALGLSWANCINVRLFLSMTKEVIGHDHERGLVDDGGAGDFVLTRRHIHVVLAPHLPPSSCEFHIVREGVFGVSRNQDRIEDQLMA